MKKYNIDFGKQVQIVKLIRTTLKSSNGDKMFVEQYWDLNGNLVFEVESNKLQENE